MDLPKSHQAAFPQSLFPNQLARSVVGKLLPGSASNLDSKSKAKASVRLRLRPSWLPYSTYFTNMKNTAGKSASSDPDIQGANCDVNLIMIGEPHWSLDASILKMMSLRQQEGETKKK